LLLIKVKRSRNRKRRANQNTPMMSKNISDTVEVSKKRKQREDEERMDTNATCQ